jgi:hypothetical protein
MFHGIKILVGFHKTISHNEFTIGVVVKYTQATLIEIRVISIILISVIGVNKSTTFTTGRRRYRKWEGKEIHTKFDSVNMNGKCEISSSHDGEYGAQNLLYCGVINSMSTDFQRYVLPPSSGRSWEFVPLLPIRLLYVGNQT